METVETRAKARFEQETRAMTGAAWKWDEQPDEVKGRYFAMCAVPDFSNGFHIFLDGNMWCAVGPHFRDLMQDRAGFGETQQAAYEAWWKDNEHSPNFRAVVHSKPDLSRFTVHL